MMDSYFPYPLFPYPLFVDSSEALKSEVIPPRENKAINAPITCKNFLREMFDSFICSKFELI
jgi:hypothetical protein